MTRLSDRQHEEHDVSEPGIEDAQPSDAPPGATASWTHRHPAITYSVARLAIFGVLVALFLVLTGNWVVSLVTAAIISSVVSVFALRKQRDALSASIATRAERANQRMAERTASEDSWDEAQRQASDADSDPGRH